MTQEHRYVGVARPPQGIDPAAPRVVLDLTRARSPTGSGDPPAASAVPASRPARYSRQAGHRRRWRRIIFRRFEVAAWLGALTVVLGMAAYVVGGVPAIWQRSPIDPQQSPVGDGAVCMFEPCARPVLSGRPTKVRIPSIKVDTDLEVLALEPDGQLAAPKSYAAAGWYGAGVPPGDPGPAILAGHVDSYDGPAVFYELHTLRSGDAIQVLRGETWITFRVTSVERYPKDQFPADRVYRPTPGAELRLITCGGDFDRNRLSYRDNIVVFAVME